MLPARILTKKVLNRMARKFCSIHSTAKMSSYIPRRAFLYVPASDWKKLQKIQSLDVDCVVMDCEDGVAINAKETARKNIVEALETLNFQPRTEYSVRVNSFSSGLAEFDIKAALTAKRLPKMINLPKVETPEHLNMFADEFRKHIGSRKLEQKISLTLMIETALGFTFMREICQRGVELSEEEQFYLDGVVFGTDDFAADIGVDRTPDMSELHAARQLFVVTAKAFGLQPLDSVFTAFRDLEGLERDCKEGCRLGYLGKQVIHPLQVPIVQKIFLPSKVRIAWANELITAFNEHQKSGKGAFVFKGKMIDMPVYIQAKNIVDLVSATQHSAR